MVWNMFAILRIVSASYFKKVVGAVSRGNKKGLTCILSEWKMHVGSFTTEVRMNFLKIKSHLCLLET